MCSFWGCTQRGAVLCCGGVLSSLGRCSRRGWTWGARGTWGFRGTIVTEQTQLSTRDLRDLPGNGSGPSLGAQKEVAKLVGRSNIT